MIVVSKINPDDETLSSHSSHHHIPGYEAVVASHASLAAFPRSRPSHRHPRTINRVPRVVVCWHDPGAQIPATRHRLTRLVMGGGVMGWEEGLVAVKRIVMVSCRIFSRRKQNYQIRRWGGMSNSSRHRWYGTKPSAGIIAHGVGVTTMRLLGASSVHRRW